MKRQGLTDSKWTRAEDYLGAMARKRTFRRRWRIRDRTEPESPQLLLSTIPFLALIGLLGVLAVAIMVIAIPRSRPLPKSAVVVEKQLGVAPKGWFQKAEREFHH
ncbi:MAG TPA: hypothetical protein VHE36_01330 [Sphingomicrobium sp.]|jgi:predicted lysophospholipase L1 biosynthesis ABC-type transport system permease subunit|nr:hypothetical protein [Sphingomicrobium sp.]